MEERYYEVIKYREGGSTVKIKARSEEDALLFAEAVEQEAWNDDYSVVYEVVGGPSR